MAAVNEGLNRKTEFIMAQKSFSMENFNNLKR
jgi:hypothetical protein